MMDLPVVEYSEQKRPSLKAVNGFKSHRRKLTAKNERFVCPARFDRDENFRSSWSQKPVTSLMMARTIWVEQQIREGSAWKSVKYLKTNASKREIDLHPDVAEYLRRYVLMDQFRAVVLHRKRNSSHLYGNLEDRWLTPRLVKLRLDEEGMGWHCL